MFSVIRVVTIQDVQDVTVIYQRIYIVIMRERAMHVGIVIQTMLVGILTIVYLVIKHGQEIRMISVLVILFIALVVILSGHMRQQYLSM